MPPAAVMFRRRRGPPFLACCATSASTSGRSIRRLNHRSRQKSTIRSVVFSGSPGLFSVNPLTFNSRQTRLHSLQPGDDLWLASRYPAGHQYYVVALLSVAALRRNPPGSELAGRYGEFAVVADRERSQDLGRRFPAEGLLRAFEFEPRKPIVYGANLGQSLQALRVLAAGEEAILKAALGRLAFLLYDSPPVLADGAPVFIHSDKVLRLVARYRGSQYLAGHKQTALPEERLVERERVWTTYRAGTIDPPPKGEFGAFWDQQNGVRALFLMDRLTAVPASLPFNVYGRLLEWGYPRGVRHRTVSLSQAAMLLRASGLPEETAAAYLAPLLG